MVGPFHAARRTVRVSLGVVVAACGDLDSSGEAAAARAPAAARRDFSVSVAGGTDILPPGATATFTVATEAAEKDSQPLTLSVTGLPAGVTAVLAPSTLNSGETALLELSAATTAAPVAATFTVTAVAYKGSTRKATGQIVIVAGAP
jgi:hypothetical protein